MASDYINNLRNQFPILQREVNGKPLIYFDNGATSQKPQVVIDAITDYYTNYNSNIHRGVHTLSQDATSAYEESRELIHQYFNTQYLEEVIFTKGTTDSINLVAYSFSKTFIQPGDEIIISALEHHSNIVPWQIACEDRGAILKVIPMNNKGELLMDEYKKLLSDKTKLVAVSHVSNSLGSINSVEEIIALAHLKGAKVLIDGAQSTPHMQVDFKALNADFYVFSGHKIFAPTGIGCLLGKKELLESMEPYQGGGDMIKTVTFEKTTYNELPHKFEAGTPNISGGIGLGVAVKFLSQLNWEEVHQHEEELLSYATQQLKEIDGIKFYGEADNKASLVSFLVDGTHPFDVGTLLDKQGVAVRTGHHCTEPIMDFFQIPGTIRASFAFYNTKEEIDIFIKALKRAVNMLR